MAQVKKQLTAMPHLLANNQGKLSLKQYKMSPQADALSARIMRFFCHLGCWAHTSLPLSYSDFLDASLASLYLENRLYKRPKTYGWLLWYRQVKRPAGAASVLWHLTHTVKTAPERRQPGIWAPGMKLGSTSLPRLHSAEDTQSRTHWQETLCL